MITLQSNPERMKNFKDNKKDWPRLTLWPAVDTTTLEKFIEVDEETVGIICPKYLEKIKHDGNWGKLGCDLSYYTLFRHIQKTDLQGWFLIVEDDVQILPKMINFEKYLPKWAGRYHYVRLYQKTQDWGESKQITQKLSWMNFQSGTVAQLIHRSGVDLLLSKLPMTDPIDLWIGHHREDLKAVTYRPQVVVNLGAKGKRDKSSKLGSTIWN